MLWFWIARFRLSVSVAVWPSALFVFFLTTSALKTFFLSGISSIFWFPFFLSWFIEWFLLFVFIISCSLFLIKIIITFSLFCLIPLLPLPFLLSSCQFSFLYIFPSFVLPLFLIPICQSFLQFHFYFFLPISLSMKKKDIVFSLSGVRSCVKYESRSTCLRCLDLPRQLLQLSTKQEYELLNWLCKRFFEIICYGVKNMLFFMVLFLCLFLSLLLFSCLLHFNLKRERERERSQEYCRCNFFFSYFL